MNGPAIWTDPAKAELAAIRLDFESKDAGWGDRFAAMAVQTVHGIEGNPLLFATINSKGSRVAPVDHFKRHGIMYRVVGDQIYIVSVLPLQSDPAKWMHRG
jgi:hypothetical protein